MEMDVFLEHINMENFFQLLKYVELMKLVKFLKGKNLYKVGFAHNLAIGIINLLYKDASIYMDRKYNKAKEYFTNEQQTMIKQTIYAFSN